MAKLIYSALSSLDGYIEDPSGSFDWAEPDDEVFAFINDLERPVGIHLYGRRMYETMVVWETDPSLADQSPLMKDFAQMWQAADKVVYSRTLRDVSTTRTAIAKSFDAEVVNQLKAVAACDLVVAGPDLAAHAFRAGLVDELHLFLTPVIVGGGKQSLPSNVRLNLKLLDERRFRGGMVHLRYRTA